MENDKIVFETEDGKEEYYILAETKLGGKITGDPVPFYDGNVTPMILKRIYYFDDSVDKR